MTDQQQSIQLRKQALKLFESGYNVTQLCSILGRSLTWFYKWFNRYKKLGTTELHNQITLPIKTIVKLFVHYKKKA